MRILVLHSRYRSGAASGENRVVEDEAQLLAEAGHEVAVYAPTARAEPSTIDYVATAARTVWSAQASRAITARISHSRPDVVHMHNLFPMLSPSVIRAVRDVPVIMTLHNYRLRCLPGTFFRDGRICEDCINRTPWPGVWHSCYQGSKAAGAALTSSLMLHRAIGTFDRIHRYIAISDFVRMKHIDAGLSPSHIVVKPHFAWPAPRRNGAGRYFLYVGRLTPEKGLVPLLRAWRQVRAPLMIVGEGPEATRLHAMAPANVEFRPKVPAHEVPGVLRDARALLMPSIWHEAAGKVVLEAYAVGVPVVASRSGALPEVVLDGETGSLVAPGDVAAWADAAARLADDAESIRMGAAAREMWRERFSPKVALANLEQVYGSIAGEL